MRVEGKVGLCWGADWKVKWGVEESRIAIARSFRTVRESRAAVRGCNHNNAFPESVSAGVS